MSILEHFASLSEQLRQLAQQGVTDLFISSGDGTIQAIQTELAECSPFPNSPRLGLLPHGTTNMTATDLGFALRDLDAQAHLIRTLNISETRNRPTLRIVNPGDGQTRHGMFLGGGAVSAATSYCQEAFNARGVRGNMASFATMVAVIGRAILRPGDGTEASRPDRAYPMTVTADGKTLCSGNQLLVLATTLERLVLGVKPFWGGHTAPLRVTVIRFPSPSLLRWTLPVLFGNEQRRMPDGIQSACATQIDIAATSNYVLDGEFFDAPAGAPLRVEAGPLFTYIRR